MDSDNLDPPERYPLAALRSKVSNAQIAGFAKSGAKVRLLDMFGPQLPSVAPFFSRMQLTLTSYLCM